VMVHFSRLIGGPSLDAATVGSVISSSSDVTVSARVIPTLNLTALALYRYGNYDCYRYRDWCFGEIEIKPSVSARTGGGRILCILASEFPSGLSWPALASWRRD
jgi:hypothetical protein